MARAKFKDVAIHERIPKKTSIGRRPKKSSIIRVFEGIKKKY